MRIFTRELEPLTPGLEQGLQPTKSENRNSQILFANDFITGSHKTFFLAPPIDYTIIRVPRKSLQNGGVITFRTILRLYSRL
jgi:hypothetical protein